MASPHMQPHPPIDEEAVAAADKEMEERANRAKELLAQRYDGIRAQQVRDLGRVRSSTSYHSELTLVFRHSL
jgi:hypothetical protein